MQIMNRWTWLAGRGRTVALFLLALLAAGGAGAQVGINLKTDRTKYFRYEPVWAEVTLCNFTANPLAFGTDDAPAGHLRFTAESKDGLPLAPTDPKANPVAGLRLGAGETKTLKLKLSELFNVQKDGIYVVTAQVGHERLSQDYRSESVAISVNGGQVVWTREFGLPAPVSKQTIPSRRATLVVFPDGKHDQFALQVEDDRMVYGLVRIGARISGSPPQCDVDAFSSIHVLFMSRPRLADYRVYDWDLTLKQTKLFMMDASAPMLSRDPDVGRVMVSGGRLAIEGRDYTLDELGKDEVESAGSGKVRETGAVPTPASDGTGPKASALLPAPSGKD